MPALQLNHAFVTFVLLHDTVVCKGVSLSKPLAVVSDLCSINSFTTPLLP